MSAKCCIEGCGRSHMALGLCDPHYRRLMAANDPLVGKAPDWGTPEERFDSGWVLSDGVVAKRAGVTTPCWLWKNPDSDSGYGALSVRGKRTSAHRFSYERYIGPIPEGLHVDHLCEQRACCNPQHLEAVTPLENNRRAWASRKSRTGESGSWARREQAPPKDPTPEDVCGITGCGGQTHLSGVCEWHHGVLASRGRSNIHIIQYGLPPKEKAPRTPKTHCIRGHELSGGNCVECRRLAATAQGRWVKRAREALGMKHVDYVAKYGQSAKVARAIVEAQEGGAA